jgi:hypothetical protein
MSYGTDLLELWERAAVVMGFDPERCQSWRHSLLSADRFQADAEHEHGPILAFPPTLLARADEVIEYPLQQGLLHGVPDQCQGAQAALDIITSFGKGQMPKGYPSPGTPAYRSAWRETIKAAEDANEPGPLQPRWSSPIRRCRRSEARTRAIRRYLYRNE